MATDRRLTILVVLGVLLVVAQGWQIARGAFTARQQWEYTIESPSDLQLAERLLALGREGWEIVSARRATGMTATGSTEASYEMILKRPRSNSVQMPPLLPAEQP